MAPNVLCREDPLSVIWIINLGVEFLGHNQQLSHVLMLPQEFRMGVSRSEFASQCLPFSLGAFPEQITGI